MIQKMVVQGQTKTAHEQECMLNKQRVRVFDAARGEEAMQRELATKVTEPRGGRRWGSVAATSAGNRAVSRYLMVSDGSGSQSHPTSGGR